MLLNDFYTIKNKERTEDKLIGSILLNTSHAIFNGHFPAIPIVPGVTLMQIVKEILEIEIGLKLILTDAKNTKFLDFINPKEINELHFEITIKSTESDSIKIQALISSKITTHFKLSANYKPIND